MDVVIRKSRFFFFENTDIIIKPLRGQRYLKILEAETVF